VLKVAILARISGCQNQKELSLEDQVDHSKEEVRDLYEGPVEYHTIATKGKGERLDRPELVEVETLIRTREFDLLVMEDTGRMVRGAAAVRLWGIAVDHGTRCIAPNDCVDTADDSWEEDLLSACRDHVGHNAHTSKRIKKKLMNRFKKYGAAVGLLVAGYTKPPDAKTYYDWQRTEAATSVILEGLNRLKRSLNCSNVADYFNSVEFPTGPHCKNEKWTGAAVRRFYKNPLLSGRPARGFRHTVKHNESGRRVSVKNTENEPTYLDIPHLAHIDATEQDELNRLLAGRNSKVGRKPVNGVDPLWQRSRKRTRFPGQSACCWYCGFHCVWGGNGMTNNLMCSNSRDWGCWNSISFNGHFATEKIVDLIGDEFFRLTGFEEQFTAIVEQAQKERSSTSNGRWTKLQNRQELLARKKENLLSAILANGSHAILANKLTELEEEDVAILQEQAVLRSHQQRELVIPANVADLRREFEESCLELATGSYEFGEILRNIVSNFHVYAVRLCDGGPLLPRARIELNLAGHISDAQFVPALSELVSTVHTIDLFELPSRERIRPEAVRLSQDGVSRRRIAQCLPGSPSERIVGAAISLNQHMQAQGLNDPFLIVSEPPSDYHKLRRHRNERYQFSSKPGYERPPLA